MARFTAAELYEHMVAVNKTKSLPKKGQKDFAPDGSEEDVTKQEQFHETFSNAIQIQRVKYRSMLAKAQWLHDKGVFKLETMKGKFWNRMGFSENSVNYLLPEEGLFLLDEGVMEVYIGGMPLSLQEMYGIVLSQHVAYNVYRVFSHLTRVGFILRRFYNVKTMDERTIYEQQLGIKSQERLKHKRKKKGHPGDEEFESKKSKVEEAYSQVESNEDKTKIKTSNADMDMLSPLGGVIYQEELGQQSKTMDERTLYEQHLGIKPQELLKHKRKKKGHHYEGEFESEKSKVEEAYSQLEPNEDKIKIKTSNADMDMLSPWDGVIYQEELGQQIEYALCQNNKKLPEKKLPDSGVQNISSCSWQDPSKHVDENTGNNLLVEACRPTSTDWPECHHHSKNQLEIQRCSLTSDINDASLSQKSTMSTFPVPQESCVVSSLSNEKLSGLQSIQSPVSDPDEMQRDKYVFQKSTCDDDFEEEPVSEYCHWDYSRVSFPDFGEQTNKKDINIAFDNIEVLPQSMRPSRSVYSYNPAELFPKPKRNFVDEDLEYSFKRKESSKIRCRDWGEYWHKLEELNQHKSDPLMSPAAPLWRGDVQPLVRPSEAVSYEAIRKKLQIFKSPDVTSEDDPCHVSHDGEGSDWCIVFEGYTPGSKFKKTVKTPPNFRIAVSRSGCDGPPDTGTMKRLVSSTSQDQVPLYWALVDNGDIAFYSFNLVQLPELN